MKFNVGKFLLIFVICFLFVSIFRSTYSSTDDIEYDYKLTEIVDENGNVPAYEYYTDQVSRSIWGLKAYDNKIFMGLGDYDENTGPAKIIYYDMNDEKIKSSGTINDEAVEWFNVIDNNLYTTGTDPTSSSWGYGSYYLYNKDDNSWIQYEFNNGWVHVFDIEKFNGKFFMSGSIESTNYSNSIIQVSNDGGMTFDDVEVYYKTTDISSLNSYLRFYNMVIFNNELYAQLTALSDEFNYYNGYYKYDSENNRFNFISGRQSCYCVDCSVNETTNKNCYIFNSKEFNDELVLLIGDLLYTTKDLVKFNKVSKIGSLAISNMLVHNNMLYLLTYKYNSSGNNFTTGIYETADLENFNKIFEFTASSLPYSFEYYDDSFFVGTISGDKVMDAGNLYKIDKINLNDEIVFDNNLVVDSDNKYISFTGYSTRNFLNSVSVFDLINMVDAGGFTIIVNDSDGNQKVSSSNIATGDKLVIYKNDKVYEEDILSVLGDVSGDGRVSLVDLVQVRKQIVGWIDKSTGNIYEKTGVYYDASDMNEDGKISLVDLVRLRKVIANWNDN